MEDDGTWFKDHIQLYHACVAAEAERERNRGESVSVIENFYENFQGEGVVKLLKISVKDMKQFTLQQKVHSFPTVVIARKKRITMHRHVLEDMIVGALDQELEDDNLRLAVARAGLPFYITELNTRIQAELENQNGG